MNKLKVLLTAGLLSISSASFATSVSYSADYNTAATLSYTNQEFGVVDNGTLAGTINLDNDGVTVTRFGALASSTTDATTSAYYDLILGSGDSNLKVFGSAANTTQQDNNLKVSIQDSAGVTLLGYEDITGIPGSDFSILLAGNTAYRILLSGTQGDAYNLRISAVPVPAAGILFATALFGAGALGRRKKKAKASVVGAFARAS